MNGGKMMTDHEKMMSGEMVKMNKGECKYDKMMKGATMMGGKKKMPMKMDKNMDKDMDSDEMKDHGGM